MKKIFNITRKIILSLSIISLMVFLIYLIPDTIVNGNRKAEYFENLWGLISFGGIAFFLITELIIICKNLIKYTIEWIFE